MSLRILTSSDIVQALPMAQAIEGMKQAYAQLSTGQVSMPLRSRIEIPACDGVTLFMPVHVTGSNDLAVKVVSVFGQNPRRNLPLLHAVVLALDAETGQPVALLEGNTLTAIRTGAGSGAATDLLARPDAAVVAILGSGTQARTQLEAVCTVRSIRSVRVYSPNPAHVEAFVREMAGKGPIPQDVRGVSTPQEAVQGADIICTATNSATPVFEGRYLKAGAHINAIGSYTTEMQEVDAETVRRALVVVDARESVLAEAGDLVIPLQRGEITLEHIHAELGEIIAGHKPGRTSPEQITYFKSCGVAVQDAVAARIALERATAACLGTVVTL
ncbi:MAG: ornithine cyclodeaminase family protein [Nitrospinota bacterium]|nr:MAG: ornithine cyclodeaminase family protein [Nitrospinota bacterium]